MTYFGFGEVHSLQMDVTGRTMWHILFSEYHIPVATTHTPAIAPLVTFLPKGFVLRF